MAIVLLVDYLLQLFVCRFVDFDWSSHIFANALFTCSRRMQRLRRLKKAKTQMRQQRQQRQQQQQNTSTTGLGSISFNFVSFRTSLSFRYFRSLSLVSFNKNVNKNKSTKIKRNENRSTTILSSIDFLLCLFWWLLLLWLVSYFI